MKLLDDVLAISDPVERALVAHDLLWNGHPQPSRLLAVRSTAIREAIDLGRPPGDIADRLQVRTSDLTWMSVGTGPSAPSA